MTRFRCDVNEVLPGRRAPVAEQHVLDVRERQRPLQQRIVVEINLADGQVIGGASRRPFAVEVPEKGVRPYSCSSKGIPRVRITRPAQFIPRARRFKALPDFLSRNAARRWKISITKHAHGPGSRSLDREHELHRNPHHLFLRLSMRKPAASKDWRTKIGRQSTRLGKCR